MIIYVKGQEMQVPEGLTVEELMVMLEYTRFAAIWINDRQVLQGHYSTCELKDRDRVLIIKPLSGG